MSNVCAADISHACSHAGWLAQFTTAVGITGGATAIARIYETVLGTKRGNPTCASKTWYCRIRKRHEIWGESLNTKSSQNGEEKMIITSPLPQFLDLSGRPLEQDICTLVSYTSTQRQTHRRSSGMRILQFPRLNQSALLAGFPRDWCPCTDFALLLSITIKDAAGRLVHNPEPAQTVLTPDYGAYLPSGATGGGIFLPRQTTLSTESCWVLLAPPAPLAPPDFKACWETTGTTGATGATGPTGFKGATELGLEQLDLQDRSVLLGATGSLYRSNPDPLDRLGQPDPLGPLEPLGPSGPNDFGTF